MGYEAMLDEAYENVKVSERCERFGILKVQGRHEGTRTVISNFYQIAACLRRSPEHLMKFLGKELASFVEIKGERLVLSRRLASKEINEKIEKYVKSFVLCPKCGKPDTELEVGAKTFLRCLACGERREIHGV
ncbi:MAG: translation initiation factor IF-2 subunit beta [archaeon]